MQHIEIEGLEKLHERVAPGRPVYDELLVPIDAGRVALLPSRADLQNGQEREGAMQKNPKLDGRAGKRRHREVEVDVRADGAKVSTNGARVGDEIRVPGNKVGDRERRGVIVSAGEAQNVKHLWVRWEDGKESLFIPFGGANVVHRKDGG